MDPIIYAIIALSCVLIFFIAVLAVFFLTHKSTPRPRPRGSPSVSGAGSSSRSRMAARWAHMDGAGSLETRPKRYADHEANEPHGEDLEEAIKPVETEGPYDFGALGGFQRRGSEIMSGSLIGTGPNGTRTFLKGWFGLDEPNFSGFNTNPDDREKPDRDAFPMRKPDPMTTPTMNVPHHRVPNTDDPDWESHSNSSIP